MAACSTDPDYPQQFDTRTFADSTAADSSGVYVNDEWKDTTYYRFDDNDSVYLHIPDSIPTGDAGDAV